MSRNILAFSILLFASSASSQAAEPKPEVHTGITLRTDPGVHPIRIGVGGGAYGLDANLVIDPMFWVDNQVHTDLVLYWHSDFDVGPMLGWRFNAVGLGALGDVNAYQVQHNLLIGMVAALPRFGPFQWYTGFEIAMMLFKHGGGAPAETISFKSGRHYIDFINLAFFLRLEYGHQFDVRLGKGEE